MDLAKENELKLLKAKEVTKEIDGGKGGGIKNYEILNKLGQGSFGVVYKVRRKTDRGLFVLKQINMAALDARSRRDAVNEASILSKLECPYIVKYYESFEDKNNLNIILEYCEGGDLYKVMKGQMGKNFSENRIWKYFIQLVIGLDYLHRKRILHRDLKSLNVFMTKDGDVRIGDLGVAKMMHDSGNFANTMVGTPYYISPEMCEEKAYNNKNDVWSLGCILYELCTFKHPFEATNQAALILKIVKGKFTPIPSTLYSQDLVSMVDWLLSRDYVKRPSTKEILARGSLIAKATQLNISLNIHHVAVEGANSLNEKNAAPAGSNKKQPAPSQQNDVVFKGPAFKESGGKERNKDLAAIGHQKSDGQIVKPEKENPPQKQAGHKLAPSNPAPVVNNVPENNNLEAQKKLQLSPKHQPQSSVGFKKPQAYAEIHGGRAKKPSGNVNNPVEQPQNQGDDRGAVKRVRKGAPMVMARNAKEPGGLRQKLVRGEANKGNVVKIARPKTSAQGGLMNKESDFMGEAEEENKFGDLIITKMDEATHIKSKTTKAEIEEVLNLPDIKKKGHVSDSSDDEEICQLHEKIQPKRMEHEQLPFASQTAGEGFQYGYDYLLENPPEYLQSKIIQDDDTLMEAGENPEEKGDGEEPTEHEEENAEQHENEEESEENLEIEDESYGDVGIREVAELDWKFDDEDPDEDITLVESKFDTTTLNYTTQEEYEKANALDENRPGLRTLRQEFVKGQQVRLLEINQKLKRLEAQINLRTAQVLKIVPEANWNILINFCKSKVKVQPNSALLYPHFLHF